MFICPTVCIQTIAHQLIQPLLEQPVNWASTKSMESCKKCENEMKRKPMSRPWGPRCATSHQTLICGRVFPLRGFYTPANSRIQRYIRCMTLGLVKSAAKQYQLKKSDTELDNMRPVYNYTHMHAHTQLTVLSVTRSLIQYPYTRLYFLW